MEGGAQRNDVASIATRNLSLTSLALFRAKTIESSVLADLHFSLVSIWGKIPFLNPDTLESYLLRKS